MGSTRRLRVSFVPPLAGLVCALLLLAGCASGEDPAAKPTATAPAASVSASPTSSDSSNAAPAAETNSQLDPGTYGSGVFTTPLTFTVPSGWKVFEDEPGQFGLALVANDGPCICVWRDVRVAAKSCAEQPEAGVAGSAAGITTWLAGREGLKTTTPKPVTVGGLRGFQMDLRLDPAWTRGCPFSDGDPVVMTLVGTTVSTGVHWGAGPGAATRLFVLDVPGGKGGNIAINVEVPAAMFDQRMAANTPVIESFSFAS